MLRIRKAGPVMAKKRDEVQIMKFPEKVREGVLKVVEDRGGRVTAGEVAGEAGLKLTETEEALRALAADTLANLQVSGEGEVVYVFPPSPRATLQAKSLMLRIQPALNAVKSGLGYLVRVSFGTTLLASLALVYAAIFALLNSSSSSDSDRRDRRVSFGPNFYFSDLFWFYDPYYHQRRQERLARGEKMNFLEAVFSFVFGDGDPNEKLDRWGPVGRLIRSKGGVVTAEELAPYLDLPQSTAQADMDSVVVEESYVVPVLQRFQGSPEVDSKGNLLYVFPSLQTSATSYRSGRDADAGEYLVEEPWKFTSAEGYQVFLTALLGAVNLGGVVFLSIMLRDPQVLQAIFAPQNAGSILPVAASLLPFLQVYAAMFFAIPAARWISVSNKNADIEERNQARIDSAKFLQRPPTRVQSKLESARAIAKRKVIRGNSIKYDTSKDVTEQNLELDEMEAFDQKLRNLDNKETGQGPQFFSDRRRVRKPNTY